jgi:TetR/AcrR family transcriptional regulator, regulator of biofilm formation and stress response
VSGPARPARGPTDPTRRDRIADAALAIALEQGVGAVSHRAVADRSRVPLGSTTYHFRSLDDLLVSAMRRAVQAYAEDLDRWSATVAGGAELVEAISAYVAAALGPDRPRTRAGYELYVAALHRPALVVPAREWAAAGRAALERHTCPDAALALTALLDGVFLQALVTGEAMPREELAAALRAVLAAFP